MEEIIKAEQEGYDAVSIDCAADPALRAAREIVHIPVTSGGLASYLVALNLGDRFSVVTVLGHTARIIEHNLRAYGLMSRVSSVIASDIPVLCLTDSGLVEDRLFQCARRVIVLGCTGMSALASSLQQRLSVPVVDPAAAAIKISELLVLMGLSHSRRCYSAPPVKLIK
jgi:allantoin racemase